MTNKINWNERPLVEFVETFHEKMPHNSKLTAINLLKNELIPEEKILNNLIHVYQYTGKERDINIWEQKVSRLKNAINLISE